MKRFIQLLLIVFILFLAYRYRDTIYEIYDQYFVPIEKKTTKLEKNDYYRDYGFNYVQNVKEFILNPSRRHYC